MKVLKRVNKTIKEILGRQFWYKNKNYIRMPYQFETRVDNEVVVENLLTREVIALTQDEYDNWDIVDRVENWYYIPDDISPKSLWYSIWHSYKTRNESKLHGEITSYTIFTTMACNANCPYCYEKGRTKKHMSPDLVNDVVSFISKYRLGKDISLHWFGGEPLVNGEIINLVCSKLQNKGISYQSNMISNGFLFNKYTDTEIRDLWKLRKVQITLDGTEVEYNRIKNYNDISESAFSVVIQNIHRLVNLNVRVIIRLNLSGENGEDLLKVADYLATEFQQTVGVYVHPLFTDPDNPVSEESKDKIWDNYILIDKKLKSNRLSNSIALDIVRTSHCMADNNHSICITTDGNLTPCEHYSDDEIVGNTWEGITNPELVEEWKEYKLHDEKCFSCWRYPKCKQLKKCPTIESCDDRYLRYWTYLEEDSLQNLHRRYQYNLQKEKLANAPYNKEEFLSAVQSEVGKTLDDRNYWKEMFPNVNPGGWCIAFIYALLKQTYGNVLTTLLWGLMPGSHPFELYNAFRKKDKIFDTPEPGDIVFYKVHSWVAHAGVVVSVSDDGKTFESIEGNVKRNGVSKVCRVVDIPVDALTVVGFGRPNFQNAKIVIPNKK